MRFIWWIPHPNRQTNNQKNWMCLCIVWRRCQNDFSLSFCTELMNKLIAKEFLIKINSVSVPFPLIFFSFSLPSICTLCIVVVLFVVDRMSNTGGVAWALCLKTLANVLSRARPVAFSCVQKREEDRQKHWQSTPRTKSGGLAALIDRNATFKKVIDWSATQNKIPLVENA